MYRGVETQFDSFLPLAVDGGEWSTHSDQSTNREEPLVFIRQVVKWSQNKPGCKEPAKGQTSIIQTVASHY